MAKLTLFTNVHGMKSIWRNEQTSVWTRGSFNYDESHEKYMLMVNEEDAILHDRFDTVYIIRDCTKIKEVDLRLIAEKDEYLKILEERNRRHSARIKHSFLFSDWA